VACGLRRLDHVSGSLRRQNIARSLFPILLWLTTTRALAGIPARLTPLQHPTAVPAGYLHGDEGVRFSCQRGDLPQIKLAMSAYLRSLEITDELVVLTERPAEGVLVYTLATPADDTSTLDFGDRPAMNLSPERLVLVPGSVGDSPSPTVSTVSRKEILLALMQHGRLTELRGPACSVEVLSEHVALRQNTVAWAENVRWGWPNGGPAEWNATYWNRGTLKYGVPLRRAIDDVFVNQRSYAIGCYTATKLVMIKGVLDFYARVHESATAEEWIQARLLSDHEPLYDVEPPRAWSFESDYDPKDAYRPGKLLSILHGVAPKNFVPGDWTYFLNTDPGSSRKVGYEGSNAVYLGRGRFDDYYGENNHAFTYAEKLDEVFQWRNGVFNRRRDAGKRRPLSPQGLERLGASPGRGGLVKAWRIAPEFFDVAVQSSGKRYRAAPSRTEPPRISAAGVGERAGLTR